MILFHFEITTLSSIWYLEQFSLRIFFVRLGINFVRKRFFAPFVPFFTHVSTPTTTRTTTATTTKLLLGPLSRARGQKTTLMPKGILAKMLLKIIKTLI